MLPDGTTAPATSEEPAANDPSPDTCPSCGAGRAVGERRGEEVAVDGWELTDTFDSRLGEVRWSRFGAPDGEPVVLLHGTPFSSDVWRDVARGLTHHHRVHVWDLPGYGASARFDGQDLSLPALTEVFVELLDHWHLTEPSVVAHDSGGAIALGAHLERRVRYRRLALVDAVALAPWGSPFGDLAGAHAEVFARLEPELHEALLRAYVGSASHRGLRPATLDALVAPWLGPDGQAAFYRQLAQRRHDQAYTDRLQNHYGTIDVPVLLCWGAEDRWVPADRGRELAARIPGSRPQILAEAGHLLPEDRPAELTALVLPFLALGGPSAPTRPAGTDRDTVASLAPGRTLLAETAARLRGRRRRWPDRPRRPPPGWR